MYRGSTNRFFELIRVHSPEVERHLDKHNLTKMLCGRLGLFKLFLQFRCEPAVVVGFVWGRPELCKETNGFILVESLAPLKSVRNLVRVFSRNPTESLSRIPIRTSNIDYPAAYHLEWNLF